jgi:hypothetical protein
MYDFELQKWTAKNVKSSEHFGKHCIWDFQGYGGLREWVDGQRDEWKDGWMDGRRGGWMDGRRDGWVDGWIDGRADG